MKKKILFIIFLTLIVFLANMNIIIAVFVITVSILNTYFLRKYKQTIPDIFYNTRRNYDEISIGSFQVDLEEIAGQQLIYITAERSFYADLLLMQRLYSFLKKSGKINIMFDFNHDYLEKISIEDLYFLHIVTIRENNIKYYNLKYYMPFLFGPIHSLKYLIWKKTKKKCFIKKQQRDERYYNTLNGLVDSLFKFAQSVGINVRLYIKDTNNVYRFLDKNDALKYVNVRD